MLCGSPPFNGEEEDEIFGNVLKGNFNFNGEEWGEVTLEAKNFIKRMFEIDTEKRYSAEEALNDPWIKYNSTKVEVDRKVSKNASHQLQNAVWTFLVSNIASNDEKKELMNTFKSFDVNGDGQLTRKELIQGYQKLFPQDDPEAEVDKIMAIVDANNSGVIDYSEFVIATMNKKNLLSKQKLEKAFKMFDSVFAIIQDKSGAISVQELKQAFQVNDENKMKQLMAEFDKNGDGEINFPEFLEMMTKLLD